MFPGVSRSVEKGKNTRLIGRATLMIAFQLFRLRSDYHEGVIWQSFKRARAKSMIYAAEDLITITLVSFLLAFSRLCWRGSS
jgi:hypothetical protein